MSVNEKMTAIADAIRDKTKGTETLSLDDMAESIGEVYEAGKQAEYDRFWDGVFQNGNRTFFMYGFTGDSFVTELEHLPYTIRPVDTSINTRSALGLFYYFNRNKMIGDNYDMTEVCKKLDLSQILSAQNMFTGAYVENVTLNLSNAERIDGIFNGADGGSRDNITLKVSEKCTNYSSAFGYCRSTTNIIFAEGSVIASDISFSHSNLLSDESIQSIINALKDLSGGTAKNITFHTDIVNKLTDEQSLLILSKNWRIV